MATNKTELMELILVELVSLFFIGLALKGIVRSIGFTLAYFIIYFLPGLPFYKRFGGLLTRYTVVNFFGLTLIPILYFIIGRFLFPISKVMFVIIPLIVFAVNYYFNNKTFITKSNK